MRAEERVDRVVLPARVGERDDPCLHRRQDREDRGERPWVRPDAGARDDEDDAGIAGEAREGGTWVAGAGGAPGPGPRDADDPARLPPARGAEDAAIRSDRTLPRAPRAHRAHLGRARNGARGVLCDDAGVRTPGPASHASHDDHDHAHDPWCGHAAVPHGDHLDYLHDGHLHHLHTDHVDEVIAELEALHQPHAGHMHVHGPGCGHDAVPHGDHVDYRHGEHLHAGHGVHYDEH